MVIDMVKSFGKMHYAEIQTEPLYMFQTEAQIEAGDPPVLLQPARTFLKQFMEDGSAWWDTAKHLPQKPDVWYIAVTDSGFIVMAERDPSMISLDNHEVIQIGHKGPAEAIRGGQWDGERVIDANPA